MSIQRQQGNALHKISNHDDHTLAQLIRTHKPARPLYVMYPDVVKTNAANFCAAFPGKALYAVKTNPSDICLRAAIEGGVQAFDVASLDEIKRVRAISPKAELHFMHTIKAPEDIHAAYHDYDVRHFVLDHEDELFKIMRETDLAQDLNLTVRVALPKNDSALIDFSAKFGAAFEEAVALLQKCRPISKALCVSFHVGTQTMDVSRYADAVRYCAHIVEAAGVDIEALNIGGGYPVTYADQPQVFTIEQCVQGVQSALQETGLDHVDLVSEPGRILVANAAKLVTRVELRKGDLLYINDGIYGGLFDAAHWVDTRYPVSAVSCDRPFSGGVMPYRLTGPTCDSLDTLNGTYELPDDVGMGDWIIFDQVGAYSQCLRSDFNGFGVADIIIAP